MNPESTLAICRDIFVERENFRDMKTLIKATIIALFALISTSCDFESTYDEDDAYYLFNGKTWSRIEESPHSYYYFVCYEFHNDGSYTYWFYEDDVRAPGPGFSIESGRWEIISHGHKDDIKLYGRGREDIYDVDDFLDGLSDHNSYSVIEGYKRTIDELYHY